MRAINPEDLVLLNRSKSCLSLRRKWKEIKVVTRVCIVCVLSLTCSMKIRGIRPKPEVDPASAGSAKIRSEPQILVETFLQKVSGFSWNLLLDVFNQYFRRYTSEPPKPKEYSLPAANEVCEGYVFTGVCLSTGGCGRPSWADTPPGLTPPVLCMLGYTHTCPVHAVIHIPSGYYGIRSTSGRYASHWNAFLSLQIFLLRLSIFWEINLIIVAH